MISEYAGWYNSFVNLGLSSGFSGLSNKFTLDARRAGEGDFNVVIKGASKATIEYIEEKETVYKVKYHVAQPGDYQIVINCNNIHIPGKNSALWAILWLIYIAM